jgi:hypothetical protein
MGARRVESALLRSHAIRASFGGAASCLRHEGDGPREDEIMFRTLVKTETLVVQDRGVHVRYFEQRTARGLRRYSAEILLGPGDRIILDDDSVTNLEARAARLVPATLYSRMLARTA